eukprot:COSAG03_NODE_4668_length_1473_cov_4.699418_2_plen_83_part_01
MEGGDPARAKSPVVAGLLAALRRGQRDWIPPRRGAWRHAGRPAGKKAWGGGGGSGRPIVNPVCARGRADSPRARGIRRKHREN